jgi:hypothetical protein
MMHLNRDLVDKIGVKQYLSPDRLETVSLSIMMDTRMRDHHSHGLQPNFHEIPTFLDTQLFYGNLLLILTIDGSTIIPFNHRQYEIILKNHVNNSIYPTERNNSNSYDISSLGTTPTSEVMSISDDEIELEPMDISSENCDDNDDDDDDDNDPPKNDKLRRRPKLLDICINPQKMCSRTLPMRPVF